MNVQTPFGTSFPEPGLTGATFDKELFSEIGDIIGKEGRAMANAGNAGLTFWAPNINIVRDPRCKSPSRSTVACDVRPQF